MKTDYKAFSFFSVGAEQVRCQPVRVKKKKKMLGPDKGPVPDASGFKAKESGPSWWVCPQTLPTDGTHPGLCSRPADPTAAS